MAILRRRVGWACVLILGAGGPALGYINPDFTPLHVERQSALICAVVLDAAPAGGKSVSVRVADVIKGKAPATVLTIDLAGALAGPDGAAAVKDLLALIEANGPQPMLLCSAARRAEDDSLMHVSGVWLRLKAGKDDGTWSFLGLDAKLNSTFAGGTDMLIKTMRFIVAEPGFGVMRADAGVRWDLTTKLGAVPGGAAALDAVDVNGDGKPEVYAASPGGDRVFVKEGDEYVALKGLAAASLAGAWEDFDGDGRADLASLNAEGLTLHLQTRPGQFVAKAVPLTQKVTSAAPSVHVVDADANGRPDLVLATGALPLVFLNRGGEEGFATVPLAASAEDQRRAGQPGPTVVADFDGDGLTDIVFCCRDDGLFFRGAAGGTFRPGVPCGAATGPVKARSACVADFDGDGAFDILLVGGGRRPALLQNRTGTGAERLFEEVFQYTGETNYIIQAGATSAAAGDFNNDTFVDLFVCYGEEQGQVFFNRGFRSFGIAEPLSLPVDELPGVDKGQSAALWADVDQDGADDLVVALANGDVHLCLTNLGAIVAPTCVRVKAARDLTYAGPLRVRFAMGRQPLGARTTGRWCPPALLGTGEPRDYTVTWQVPGGPEERRAVVVEGKAVEVTIGRPKPGP